MQNWQPKYPNYSKEDLTRSEKISFEKTRFEYCYNLYRQGLEARELLDKKIQFHLSFVTLLLGAIFLKVEFFTKLGELLKQQTTPSQIKWATYLALSTSGLSVLVFLIAVIIATRLRVYKSPSPNTLIFDLFNQSSPYKFEQTFIRDTALLYAVATEFSRKVNKYKEKWVHLAEISILITIVSLATLLGIFAFLSLV
jgi:hypothetical protein